MATPTFREVLDTIQDKVDGPTFDVLLRELEGAAAARSVQRTSVPELRGIEQAALDARDAEDFGRADEYQHGYAQGVRDLAAWLAGDTDRTELLELVIEGPEEEYDHSRAKEDQRNEGLRNPAT